MQTASGSDRRWKYAGFGVTALWGVSLIVARMALDKDLQLEPKSLRVAAALLPVIPTALFLWFVVMAVRGLDELHQRVHLEALAVAYPLAILLLVTLGFLELAIDLSPEDWSYRHVWVYLPIFYLGGLCLAWRRYR